MSSQWGNGERASQQRIKDEEGTVDQKLKERIISARNRVDERWDALYVGAPLEGFGLSEQQKADVLGHSVRQYLMAIEPLLRSNNVVNARQYYTEVEIATEPLHPPNGKYPKKGSPMYGQIEQRPYRWDLFNNADMSRRRAMQSHGSDLFGRAFEPPKPRKAELKGLKSVIETERINEQWTVVLNPGAIGPEQITFFPSVEMPLPRRWLRDAVRYADQFLQEAGIAVDTGLKEIDDPENEPV